MPLLIRQTNFFTFQLALEAWSICYCIFFWKWPKEDIFWQLISNMTGGGASWQSGPISQIQPDQVLQNHYSTTWQLPHNRTNITTPLKFKTTGIMVTSSKNVIKCFLEISSPKHYCCYFKSVCHCQDLLSIFSNKKANAL